MKSFSPVFVYRRIVFDRIDVFLQYFSEFLLNYTTVLILVVYYHILTHTQLETLW